MKVYAFDWDEHNIGHILEHQVENSECEEAFAGKHCIFVARDGRYSLLGRSAEGRYLIIIFEYKGNGVIRVVTAREMGPSERKLYNKKV